jgi:hypothetical protein
VGKAKYSLSLGTTPIAEDSFVPDLPFVIKPPTILLVLKLRELTHVDIVSVEECDQLSEALLWNGRPWQIQVNLIADTLPPGHSPNP